jgi:hypothetical protein
MPGLLENRTGDLAKSGETKRIQKIPADIETIYIFLCLKERKLRVPNQAQFSDRVEAAGYPMTFRASPTLPLSLH